MKKKTCCIAIVAHVDSGKTTLSESMLYLSGNIRKLGRVDNKDAFLDTYELERDRGITIFSKQAVLSLEHMNIMLLDTPGHVDFSAEMERTLQVLDYAVLVISGADGIQGHTLTLWRLLAKYQIPVFIFVNKMDQNGTNPDEIMKQLHQKLSDGCVVFGDETAEFYELVAMCEEGLLEEFLHTDSVSLPNIQQAILNRHVFPCYFGSALKLNGVTEFMQGLERYTCEKAYPEEFGAKIFKIARDEQGNRLTYLKVTGGSLKVKSAPTEENEKINQIRIYSGAKFESVSEVSAGSICAVTGLTKTKAGQGLGIEKASGMPVLEPVLNYQLVLPEGCDAAMMLPKLLMLEEEIPELHIVWNEILKEIHVQIMGEVQTEVLKRLIQERFGVEISFGTGNIVYKETIAGTVEGIGHFEPLRHYAEVHLKMEPLEVGSGLEFATDCSEDILSRNWQRLILTHLYEKEHIGVLTGSPITDMRITLIGGRAHQKHTEGGDFRQATYRAVRQGLKKATSVLLEPYYEFRLEIPEAFIGRAMTDIEKMYGKFDTPTMEGGTAVMTGCAPAVTMREYQKDVIAYTKGHGRLSCSLRGYQPCHNTEEVVESINYDSERDLDNPTGSVFCAHGAGFIVPWDQVENYMHLENQIPTINQEITEIKEDTWSEEKDLIGVDEIDSILEKTYYANKKDGFIPHKGISGKRMKVNATPTVRNYQKKERTEEFLLVDGYNVIFGCEELKTLADENMDSAKYKLMDLLCNYQGSRGCHIILVFDAYRMEGHQTEIFTYHNIRVVYTKEAETADMYIEKFAHENASKYQVTVATSDGLEQIIIRGKGCFLLSARDLWEEMMLSAKKNREEFIEKQKSTRNYLFDHLDDNLAEHMEKLRKGES